MDQQKEIKNRTIFHGDCLEVLKGLPDGSVDCCVTSPPYYGLRDYGNDKQIGLEETPEEYIKKLTDVFHEVKRVLKDNGTLWLNIGDSYNGAKKGNTEVNKHKNVATDSFEKKLWSGAKPKDLIGIPWMLAFALRNDGWYLRQDIIWHKPNPMPEPVKDRCTKSHEYIFLLSKSQQYYFDYEKIQEDAVSNVGDARIRFGGSKYGDNNDRKFAIYSGNEWTPTTTRNKRDVWDIPVQPTKEAHFATFPERLVEPCILAGCPEDGMVIDPFFGSGTTGRVAERLGREWCGIELNPDYIDIAMKRTDNVQRQLLI